MRTDRGRRASLSLAGVTLVFVCATLAEGGMLAQHWNVCLLSLGVLVPFYWLKTPVLGVPASGPGSCWPVALLPSYVALQLVPLPEAVLGILSPARAAMLGSLEPVMGEIYWAPVSAFPPATMAHFLRVCAYVLVFLLARNLAQSRRERRWALAIPVLVVAALQAAVGIFSVLGGKSVDGVHGTYVNRNHFAGLLVMALPFAFLWALDMLRQWGNSESGPWWVAQACLSVLLAGLLLTGILLSLSRAAFAVTVLSTGVVAWIGLRWRTPARSARHRRWVPGLSGALAGVVAVVSLLFWLPSEPLLARFAALGGTAQVSAEGRVQLWKDTVVMIADYPLAGCGLGAYVSVFAKYNTASLSKTDDYAHNDFMQFLAELGIVGFIITAGLLLTPWVQSLRRITRTDDWEMRLLLLAAFGAMTAILLHSLVDFHLYIPANASVFAWILGLAVGVGRNDQHLPLPDRMAFGKRAAL